MSNKTNIAAADCLTTTDLPAALNTLLSNGFSTTTLSSSDTVIPSDNVILSNNCFNNGQQRRRNGNGNGNNGLRNNMGRKKQFYQQQQHAMDSAIFSSTFSSTVSPTYPSSHPPTLPSSHPSTHAPSLFSSPSPPLSLSSSTEIRPQRKPRKSKKSRAGTNPPSRPTPLSPSAASSCSLASYATTSSGLSSGASSMRTLNDPDSLTIIPDSPDNTVIKSSSSSAASSAGFGDMTSNDDEDFHERCLLSGLYDEPMTLDPMQFSRQWSLPNGMPEVENPMPASKPKNSRRKNNHHKYLPTKNYPNISDPGVLQFFYALNKIIFHRIIAVLNSKLSTTTVYPEGGMPRALGRQFSEPKGAAPSFFEDFPHQHLGLPPLPPPSEIIDIWRYPLYSQTYLLAFEDIIIPSACEEAFFNHFNSYQIPKRIRQIKKQSSTVESLPTKTSSNSDKTPTIPVSPISKTRADFHEQIRERLLLAAAENISDSSIQTTPIKKQPQQQHGYDSKLKCSLSDAAALAGVSTPPAPQPQGRLSEDQSLFLQSLPLRRPFNSSPSEPAAAPKHQFSISYASVIQAATTIPSSPALIAAGILPSSKPTPLNALNLPPLSSIGYDKGTTTIPTTPKSSRLGSSASTSSTKKSKKNGCRTFENRLLSTSSSTTSTSTPSGNNGNGKRNNNHNKNKNSKKIEFCMKENDFPPISTLSTTSLSKDLSSSLSQKGLPAMYLPVKEGFMQTVPRYTTPFKKYREAFWKAYLESDNNNKVLKSLLLDEEAVQGSCSSEDDNNTLEAAEEVEEKEEEVECDLEVERCCPPSFSCDEDGGESSAFGDDEDCVFTANELSPSSSRSSTPDYFPFVSSMKDSEFPPLNEVLTSSESGSSEEATSKPMSKSARRAFSKKNKWRALPNGILTEGESGYHSEFSAQCSTADGETDSRCSDPVHRNYSSVVANGSKSSCADLSESKEDTISSVEDDDCTSVVPEDDDHEDYDISRMDVLSEHICDYYEQVSQTERTLLRKLRLRDMLYYSLAPLFPVCGLYVVGSSLNGFGNENSDMDLCLVITNGELDQRTTAIQVLLMVENALASLSTVQEQTLIRAKVPILRIKFRGPFSDIVVDLNANNLVAVRNTHLLCYYAFFDWRVRPLVTVIKEWAKQSSINDASRSTFTSYSLVLMVLHYLQVLKEPIIPSLQNQFPKRFNKKIDIRTLNLSHPLDEYSSQNKFKRENKSSLATLLIGFFHYYACEYDYDKNAISIRLGREVERADVIKDRTQWSPICIEEPFTHLNTAHSIYDVRVFESIKQKFQDAYEILSSTWDLSNLLTPPRNGAAAAV